MKAGDKAVLSCETDSLPEPAVTWYKDRRPLAPAQRARTLQGGQRLEILDTQVSNPVAWAAMQCHLLVLVGGGGGAAAASACKTPSRGGEGQPRGLDSGKGTGLGTDPQNALGWTPPPPPASVSGDLEASPGRLVLTPWE